MDVWNPKVEEGRSDFKLDLEYREFTSEMLLSLVSQSVQCSQLIKFDCYKAKLGLHQFTWFKPADPKASRVVSIGDAKRNTCPCYSSKEIRESGCPMRQYINIRIFFY
jgi:hypothetical protein